MFDTINGWVAIMTEILSGLVVLAIITGVLFDDPFGFDSLFYYNAQQTCNRESQDGEYGIVYLKKEKRKTLLVRKKIFSLTYKGKPYKSPEKHCTFNVIRPDDCLIVTSFIPKDVESLFPNKNSILSFSSKSPFSNSTMASDKDNFFPLIL